MKKFKHLSVALLVSSVFIGISAFRICKSSTVNEDPAQVASGFTTYKSPILVLLYSEEHSKDHGIIDADRRIRMKINKNLKESFKANYTGDYDFVLQNTDVISDENGLRIVNPSFTDSAKHRYLFYVEERQSGDQWDCYMKFYDLKDKKKYGLKEPSSFTGAGTVKKYVEELEEARAK
jgi:hypothetical protein